MDPRDEIGRLPRHQRVLGVLAACAVLLAATGCGARWSDEDRAAVLARHEGGVAAGPGTQEEGGAAAEDGATSATSTPGATVGGGGSSPSGSGGDGGAAGVPGAEASG
ncbi:MAG: hypothetical protein ACRDZU_04625, partial [Acidimicrobiales bacterium]